MVVDLYDSAVDRPHAQPDDIGYYPIPHKGSDPNRYVIGARNRVADTGIDPPKLDLFRNSQGLTNLGGLT